MGKHPEVVFTYRGKPVTQVNTKAWRSALKTAGIVDFRWHDLRHAWASWHVQAGTPLHVLHAEVGEGRRSSRQSGYDLATLPLMKKACIAASLELMARPAGFEPTTP